MVTLTVVVLWVGVYPFTLVPPLGWAAVFSLLLTASAAYHNFIDREMTLTEYVDEGDGAE